MLKILSYELRRLLLNKFFIGLFVINGFYAWYILSTDTIAGVAYTAPFSPWSYGAYLAGILPLLLVTLLFLITFMYSNREKQVKQITFATGINLRKYCLVKCAAAATGYVIISMLVIVVSFIFYGLVFGFYGFGNFITPVLLTILPAMFFIFGAGLLAGFFHHYLLYVLMAAVILFGLLPLPEFFDLYGGRFFSEYPLTLPAGIDGEPVFSLPLPFVLGKTLFGIAGILMILAGVNLYSKRGR